MALAFETRRSIELVLLENPKAGLLIPDTNGDRKIRQGVPGSSKSGGIRVFYYDSDSLGRIYLLAVIQKNDQENLNKEQRNELGAMIAAMKRGLK